MTAATLISRIESGVPVPPRSPCGVWLEAARKMRSGDSIGGLSHTERSYLERMILRNGHHTTSRKENGTGYRVWKLQAKRGHP